MTGPQNTARILLVLASVSIGCGHKESSRKRAEGNAHPAKVLQLADWCKSDEIADEAKRTLDAMIKSLSARDCYEFEYRYSKLERRRLSVAFEQLTDPAPILALKDLQELSLRGNKFSSVNWTRALEHLTSLDMTANPLTDGGLTVVKTKDIAPQLSDLILEQTGILAVEFDSASKLTRLSLAFNGIQDLSFLASGAHSLIQLNLSGNPLSELNVLARLSSLKELTLNDLPVSVQPSTIWLPKGLETLRLAVSQSGAFGVNLSDLPQLDVLQNLMLSNRVIEGDFSDHKALIDLNIEGSKLSDVALLARFSKLQVLNLNGVSLTYLPDLSKMTYLTMLSADRTSLVMVDGSNLPSGIRSISLDDCHISAIRNGEQLDTLAELSLKGNGIESLQTFSWPASLVALDLSQNAVENLQPLDSLTTLVTLRLSRNRIKNPSPLASLINLEWLDLSGNQIDSPAALEPLAKLTMLDLRANGLPATTTCPLENVSACLF